MTTLPFHTVLVPALLCSPRLYTPLLPTVWAHGAATIADTRRDESIAGMADRLLATAPKRFALVAVSMGGYVALEVARRAPERIIALGLISTSARPDTPEQVMGRLAQNAAVIEGRFSELVERTFPVLVDPAHEQDADLMDFWCQTASEVGGDAFVRQNLAAVKRADMRPLLPSITVPTAVIHGRGDRLIPPEHGEALAARIPGALLTLIDDAGHLVVHEQPVAVAAAVDALLTRCDQR